MNENSHDKKTVLLRRAVALFAVGCNTEFGINHPKNSERPNDAAKSGPQPANDSMNGASQSDPDIRGGGFFVGMVIGPRAVGIRAHVDDSPANPVLPQSRICVIWTPHDENSESQVLLENVLVLAVDKVSPPGEKHVAKVTLLLPDAEGTLRLRLAAEIGTITVSPCAPKSSKPPFEPTTAP